MELSREQLCPSGGAKDNYELVFIQPQIVQDNFFRLLIQMCGHARIVPAPAVNIGIGLQSGVDPAYEFGKRSG